MDGANKSLLYQVNKQNCALRRHTLFKKSEHAPVTLKRRDQLSHGGFISGLNVSVAPAAVAWRLALQNASRKVLGSNLIKVRWNISALIALTRFRFFCGSCGKAGTTQSIFIYSADPSLRA